MKKTKYLFAGLAIIILAAAIFLRFWQLDTIPPGIQYDEAYNGINALEAIETGNYKVFYPENFGREGFHLNVESIFIRFFGAENFSLRLANALWGSLTVIGFFLLLWQLKFSRLSILLGTFMLGFSFWHLNFSRTSYRAIMVPLLITWSSYFFFQGFYNKKNKALFFALSGATLGLGFHTYIAFRVAPLIIIILALTLAFSQKDFIKKYHRQALLFFFAALLVALPIFVYFYNHRNDLTGRSEAVSVFNAPNMSFAQAFTKSLSSHLGAFFFLGDSNQRHNHNSQPIIPLAWSVLLVLGFLISLKEIFHYLYLRIKNRKKSLPTPSPLLYPAVLGQSIFWVMLIPGILSIEGIPHSLRIIGTIPGVFLLCSLPFEYVLKLYSRIQNSATFPLKPWRWNLLRISIFGLVLIIALSGISQTYLYFGLWAKDPKTAGAFEKKLYDLGKLIKKVPPKEHNYLITSYNIAISQDRKSSSLKTTEYIAYPNIKKYQFMHPLDGRFGVECENTLIVFQESDTWLRAQFKDRCPNLTAQEMGYNDSSYKFWVLQ